MKILKHSAENFRNIENISFVPDEEMNIIYGENGQGKTNIIESIWMMTGFYSFRARKNNQLIEYGKDEAKIKTEFYSGGREQKAEMSIGQRKELILNGVKEESPRAIMGTFPGVVFSPGTLGVVQDGPSERRKLLDVALTLIKPNYASIMSRYLRIIDQRNSLLKKYGENTFKKEYIYAPWDEELVKTGTKIIKYRLDYIEMLSSLSAEIYEGISSSRENFNFRYDFSSENISEEDIAKKLASELEKSRDADVRRLYTGAGPHSHDLILYLNGKDARMFGSQGQQRSCALAMKLAEASIIEKTTGESPIILLDDVMSELDGGRQNFILNYLENRQVFITCCDPYQLNRKEKGKVFEVTNGCLTSNI